MPKHAWRTDQDACKCFYLKTAMGFLYQNPKYFDINNYAFWNMYYGLSCDVFAPYMSFVEVKQKKWGCLIV